MNRIVKRLFDIISSLVSLVVFSPLLLAIYIGQKLSYRGPAIYVQERIGKGGAPFNIYKFRTMVNDSETDGVPQLAEPDDERLTRFGKFLRSHHLDELPQLWNVLRGDMSFIGPRPERKFFVEKILERDPRYVELYQIRPGITSYATLYNGYTDTMEKMLRRLELDLYYLEHQSWSFDLQILWKTFISIVFGKKF
jgi:lipopolysaccharide/colanic/teichoic acid biosynthesis glycosyltransferase